MPRQIHLSRDERTGEARVTGVAHDVVYHSPTGFEWGYGGSGPSDLALNILHSLFPPTGDATDVTYPCVEPSCGAHDHGSATCGRGWAGRCARSKGPRCRCQCGGRNHGGGRAVRATRGRRGVPVSQVAARLYQEFKREVIAALPRDGGTIDVDAVRAWASGRWETLQALQEADHAAA